MKKSYNTAFVILFAVTAIVYLSLMFNNAVWYDEAYTMAMVKHSFSDICSITANDVHPPLYYILLKMFIAPFGYSLFAAKIFSALPLLLMMILGYVKLSEFTDRRTGFLFALMTAFLPVMTTFSVEIRMYGWAALFVTGCAFYAYSAYKDENPLDYFIFMMFGVLAAYTHYFALVSAGIVYIMLFIGGIRKRKLKSFILSAAGTVILYLPWLAAFVSQLADKVANEYWIAPITVKTVLNYFNVWFKCAEYTPVYLAGTGILALTAAISLIISKNKTLKIVAFCAVLIFVFTNIIGITASVIVRPVFIERYAVPALPLLLAALALGLGAMNKKSVTVIVSLFFSVGFAVNYPSAAKTEYEASELQLEQYLNEADYEALVCYVDAHLYGVLSYYSKNAPVYRPKLSKGSPFENIYALSELDTASCKWAALFVPSGMEVPAEISANFNADYVRKVYTYGIECDMYNLWK